MKICAKKKHWLDWLFRWLGKSRSPW